MSPTIAQTAMADFAESNHPTFASNYLTPSAKVAAVNAFEAARLARLAGLISWAEALQRRTYRSRPDGVTARAEAAERFEAELERVPVPMNRDALSIHVLAHVLVGEPVSTSPGHALVPERA